MSLGIGRTSDTRLHLRKEISKHAIVNIYLAKPKSGALYKTGNKLKNIAFKEIFRLNVTRGNFTASSGFSVCQTKLAGKSNSENSGTKALCEGARIGK